MGSLKTQISQKIQKPKHVAKKNTHIHKRLDRGTLNTCTKFQGLISKKRRGRWTLNELGGWCLNQPASKAVFAEESKAVIDEVRAVFDEGGGKTAQLHKGGAKRAETSQACVRDDELWPLATWWRRRVFARLRSAKKDRRFGASVQRTLANICIQFSRLCVGSL